MRFKTFHAAMAWANVHARDYCHVFHAWRVQRQGDVFRVAIYSRNTGALSHYA